MKHVYVIRNDYDQSTMCVVDATSEVEALEIANKEFEGNGDFYTIVVPLIAAPRKEKGNG